MTTHDHDHDDLPGEDELKALYRSLPRKQPSPALDAAIKRKAAEAVRAQVQRRPLRWPVAAASVAVLVVAAGLSWRMTQQPSSVPQIPSAPLAVAASAASTQADNVAQAPGTAERAEPPAASVVSASPAAAPAARMAAPLRPKQENIRSAMKPKVLAPTVATKQVPVAASSPIATLREARLADAPPPAPAPAAPPSPMAEAGSRNDALQPAAPALSEAKVPAAYSAPSPVTPTPAGNVQRAANAMKTLAAPAPMEVDATAADPADTPLQELAKIRRLFALQRHDEAMQRLRAFRQAHPEMPLPADLQAHMADGSAPPPTHE